MMVHKFRWLQDPLSYFGQGFFLRKGDKMKKTMITGVAPTGGFTLGNYIGAIKNFVALQSEYNSYIFIADLHALTLYQDPKKIKKRILDLAAIYIACGIDPKQTNFFIQSNVNEHSALGFLVAFQCRVGELSRMTQYKLKKEKGGVDVGLFIYPALMAADILLYDAEVVPVGADQKQHIEITRDLGERMNKRYGEMFKLPQYYIPKVGNKIMNLQNPLDKMNKSADVDDKGTIFMLDDVKEVKKKIMSAVTDSDNVIKYDEKNKPGISNLMTIMAVLTDKTIKEIGKLYQDSNYGQFKKDLVDIVEEFLIEFQKRYYKIRDSKELLVILKNGANEAKKQAECKLKVVKEKIGIDV